MRVFVAIVYVKEIFSFVTDEVLGVYDTESKAVQAIEAYREVHCVKNSAIHETELQTERDI